MKILCAFYPIQDPGGITNHQEMLGAALQELGHRVEVRCLYWQNVIRASAEPRRSIAQEIGASTGMRLDQQAGWFWPAGNRVAYKGDENIARWKEYASKFDLIIWQTTVPGKRQDTAGNTDWLQLYDIPVKQIGMVHDGNIADGYPWIYEVADKLYGLVGVHPCAFTGAGRVPVRSALIPNPHWRPLERAVIAEPRSRSGWVSVQTFKAWKHVPDLVRAVPYMRFRGNRTVAGGGIDYHYLTSVEKTKPVYYAAQARDPDLPVQFEGMRIWDLAVAHGMNYLGYISNTERDKELRKHKYLIDPSWSRKYAKYGDHFNRTPVEGIIAGCVPIARNLGMSDNEAGNGLLFKPDNNYHMIPWNATPKEFGEEVNDIMNQSEKLRMQKLDEARGILPHFDAHRVAQQFIDFSKGKKVGLKYCSLGAEDATMRAAAKAAMEGHFSCA